MSFAAKYNGTCSVCKRYISKGELIDGNSRSGYKHADCSSDLRQPTQSAAPKTVSEVKTAAAKYAGKCSRCGGQIAVGDPIAYGGGEKAYHASGCQQQPRPRRVTPQVASRQEQQDTYHDVGPMAWDDDTFREPEPDDFDW